MMTQFQYQLVNLKTGFPINVRQILKLRLWRLAKLIVKGIQCLIELITDITVSQMLQLNNITQELSPNILENRLIKQLQIAGYLWQFDKAGLILNLCFCADRWLPGLKKSFMADRWRRQHDT